MNALPKDIESIHPGLWRATQLARATWRTVDTRYPALSDELPGGGWPLGTMTELLLQQAGIGEMRLLGPAMAAVSNKRPIALIAPQQIPNAHGYAYMGIDPGKLMWLKAAKSSDALWSAEQILRAGSCGALVLWQHISEQSRLGACCWPHRALRCCLSSCGRWRVQRTRHLRRLDLPFGPSLNASPSN
jgi:protein ImuA